MPGKRLLLDTNAVVALLQGHTGLVTLTDSAEWLGISVITALEFSGFAGLTDADRALFAEFTTRVSVIDLSDGRIECSDNLGGRLEFSPTTPRGTVAQLLGGTEIAGERDSILVKPFSCQRF